MKEVKGFLTSFGLFCSTKEEAERAELLYQLKEDIDEHLDSVYVTPEEVIDYIADHFTLVPKPSGKYRRWEGNRW